MKQLLKVNTRKLSLQAAETPSRASHCIIQHPSQKVSLCVLHTEKNLSLLCRLTHLLGGHLLAGGLHDEPEAVAGDGADAEGRHEDRKVLRRQQELAQEL